VEGVWVRGGACKVLYHAKLICTSTHDGENARSIAPFNVAKAARP
jgi:hypothetical protein